jgi:hypothetical protein
VKLLEDEIVKHLTKEAGYPAGTVCKPYPDTFASSGLTQTKNAVLVQYGGFQIERSQSTNRGPHAQAGEILIEIQFLTAGTKTHTGAYVLMQKTLTALSRWVPGKAVLDSGFSPGLQGLIPLRSDLIDKTSNSIWIWGQQYALPVLYLC